MLKSRRILPRSATLSFAVLTLFAGVSPAQTSTTPTVKTPIYDVTTIKPNHSLSGSMSINTNLNTFSATNVTIKMMLENAFGIRQDIMYGLPGWAESAHYDIVAKATDADAATMRQLTREQWRAMLKQLLADRFKITTHLETKELPVFDLLIAKGGIKFHEFNHNDPSAKQGSMTVNNTEMNGYGIPMESLAKMLEGQVERNVIDKTGLTGKYDLHLKWRGEQDGADNGSDDQSPTLFTALQEELGVRLQSSKGPVDTLVIDHIEAPSEN